MLQEYSPGHTCEGLALHKRSPVIQSHLVFIHGHKVHKQGKLLVIISQQVYKVYEFIRVYDWWALVYFVPL